MKPLTLSQIAQTLKLAPSTVRYYAKNYAEFLPSQKIEGVRWPVFEIEAKEIIKTIADQTQKGKKREEIKIALSKRYSPVFDGETPSEKLPTAIPQHDNKPTHNIPTSTALQQVVSFSQSLTELNSMMSDYNARRDKFTRKLSHETKHQQAKIEELETNIQQLQEQLDDTLKQLKKAQSGGLLKKIGLT